jgi:hypothetical protein
MVQTREGLGDIKGGGGGVHPREQVGLHLVGVGRMGGTPSKAAAVRLCKKQGMNKRMSE